MPVFLADADVRVVWKTLYLVLLKGDKGLLPLQWFGVLSFNKLAIFFFRSFQLFLFVLIYVFILSRCSCLSSLLCSFFQMFLFSDVPVFQCTCFPVYLFSDVPISQSSCFPVFLFSVVPVFKCSCFQMFLFPVFPFLDVPVFQCSSFSFPAV